MHAQAAVQELRAEEEREKAQKALDEEFVASALLAHVQDCFTKAESAKSGSGIVGNLSITNMLLECKDRRSGVHTAKVREKITEQKLPDFYEPLTDQKCRDALSWWNDATAAYGHDWFKAEPTKEPELPDAIVQNIQYQAQLDLAQITDSGQVQVDDDTFEKVVEDAIRRARKEILVRAKTLAIRMETRIKDQFQDCDFSAVRDDFRDHLVSYGTAFYWGPYVKMVKVPTWKDGHRVVERVPKPWVDAPDPQDIFPAPWMTEVTDHGYICRRMKVVPGELAAFKGLPGWKDDAISALIESNNKPPVAGVVGDDQRSIREGKEQSADQRGDFIWFVGHLPGRLLKEHGMDSAEEDREYHVHVCWMGQHLLCVRPNWWDMELPPCHKAVFDKVTGSFWGLGVPMKMRRAQDKANAIVIPMLDNIGWAAGGVTEVDQHRMVDPREATKWHARKVVLCKEPDLPTTLPAVRHTQIPLRSAELSTLLKDTGNEADEQSGVRKYSLGSDKVAGAGRTRGGLAMLMDASSKTLKYAMFHGDAAESSLVGSFADWNMQFGPDDIKGDIKIVTNGSSGFFVEELQLQQLEAMIDRLLNPQLLQIIGPQQVIALIREMGTRMRVDVRYIPSDQEIEDRIEQIKMESQAAAEEAAPASPSKGGANTAGSPPRPENRTALPAGV